MTRLSTRAYREREQVAARMPNEASPAPSRTSVARCVIEAGIVQRPALFSRLRGAARVTQVSALAGAGKTVLLRSWMRDPPIAPAAAYVAIPHDTCDPRLLWRLVIDALGRTVEGAKLLRASSAPSDLDGRTIREKLLQDLCGLQKPLWLIIDDLQELRSEEALRELEHLVVRAALPLRFILAARQDVPLGLHRLRLAGELSEIRTDDLRFSREEARALLAAASLKLSEPALNLLQGCTEGWAAGLKLAALALADQPDPERLATEFCGSERGVAEYLLAEVLQRLSEPVRQMLLRTSILERVNGALADHLTGGTGSEGMLRALEKANAFVFAMDAERTWFRYHPLLADLLRFELRNTVPTELPGLHAAAAQWYEAHGNSTQFLDSPGGNGQQSRALGNGGLLEPLSDAESRVLHYLPTNLSRSEIAGELYVSVNTVKTHMSRVFAKLGAHSRTQAVERARGLGLLAPKPRQPVRHRPATVHGASARALAGTEARQSGHMTLRR